MSVILKKKPFISLRKKSMPKLYGKKVSLRKDKAKNDRRK